MTVAQLGAGSALIAAVAVVIHLRSRYRVVTVHGDSMLPTFAAGARVLVRRASLPAVNAEDVVVIAHPWREQLNALGAEPWMIKRAVALPGDGVPVAVLQGLRDDRTRIGPRTPPLPVGAVVPDGALIVLGDNPDGSTDSRHFGYARSQDLLGVVVRTL
ncbi:MAG TPA: signal peptidase I [Jiangellaceae bacterium]